MDKCIEEYEGKRTKSWTEMYDYMVDPKNMPNLIEKDK